MIEEEDNHKHFDWCWNKLIDNFKKESIHFNIDGEHYDFLKGFIIETFYNQKINFQLKKITLRKPWIRDPTC